MYTFAQPLNRALRTASESPAVVCQDNRRTYAELGSRCRRLAGAMHKLGLAPQDRVGVIALNSDRYLELYLGLPAAGYVLVPVNSRLAPAEMRAILDDAGVSVVFADADYPGAAGVSQVLTMPDDYEDLLAAADEIPLGEGVGEDDLAALFYTSGTTGAPKGAMHTHRSLVSSALHFMATWPFDRQTRWLVASPMFHTGGILATLATVWAGGTHVIMPRFDPDLAVDLIEREAVTHTLLVPTMLAAAAGAQLARPRNVRSLRYLSHGASPISAETLRRTRQAFPGAELLHVYGTTETTPITTLLPHEERILDTPLVRSCGQPAVGVEIRILDDALDDLPPRTVGQIAVRSPSVMAGYWRKPHETAEAMRGDWYLSGDLGYRDQDSYIYLVDRVKDMIVSGGENIYSTEVEDALATYPGVEEVAVFGVPDPRWGESVYAIVSCREPVPRCIELRTEPLPKSAAGKILKRELREPHWAGQQAQVSGG
jgi:long-chain acyl-CoA synthetase